MDYYQVLEVEKDADLNMIKRSYKKLALKYHPDKNNGDDTKFKEISEAYETLSDPEKRQMYDMGGNGGGIHDIFANLFKGQRSRIVKRQNYVHNINITLKDAYFGIQKKLKVVVKKFCLDCKSKCSTCRGNGMINIQQGPFIMSIPCNACKGLKITNVYNKNCSYCQGTFEKTENVQCVIDIPAGVHNGQSIVKKDLGEQIHSRDEEPGDLVFQISISKDVHFTRKDNDLYHDVKLTFRESILGKDIIIPHFAGIIRLNTNVYGVIDPTKFYFIENKGMDTVGKLYLKFKINYPSERYSDAVLEKLDNIL
jgi:molecular chaperone DnaJ